MSGPKETIRLIVMTTARHGGDEHRRGQLLQEIFDEALHQAGEVLP